VQRLVEPEGEDGLRGYFDPASTGEDLGGSSRGRSGGGSDGGSSAASGDGSEEGAEDGSSADHFGGAAILTEAFAAGALDVFGADVVLAAGDGDGIEVEGELRGSNASGGRLADDEAGIGTPGDEGGPIRAEDVTVNDGGEGGAFGGAG